MSYPGYCKSYPKYQPELIAIATPVALNVAFQAAVGAPLWVGVVSTVFAAWTGFAGVLVAGKAHDRQDAQLRNQGVGLTKGSAAVLQAQRNAYMGYVAPLMLGWAMIGAATSYMDKTEEEPNADIASFEEIVPDTITTQRYDIRLNRVV